MFDCLVLSLEWLYIFPGTVPKFLWYQETDGADLLNHRRELQPAKIRFLDLFLNNSTVLVAYHADLQPLQ